MWVVTASHSATNRELHVALLSVKQDIISRLVAIRPTFDDRNSDARVTVGYVQMTPASRRLPRNATNKQSAGSKEGTKQQAGRWP